VFVQILYMRDAIMSILLDGNDRHWDPKGASRAVQADLEIGLKRLVHHASNQRHGQSSASFLTGDGIRSRNAIQVFR